jgi:hypothetical protein
MVSAPLPAMIVSEAVAVLAEMTNPSVWPVSVSVINVEPDTVMF